MSDLNLQDPNSSIYNIPYTPKTSANVPFSPAAGNSGIVKLVSQTSGDIVFFRASPEIEENGNTIYISLDDIRAPASYMLYMGSPSRTFSINAKLVSRTAAEATENFKYKSLLQAWRMPLEAFAGQDSTPETLRLYGYNKNFQGITVVVSSINFSFPSDIDYVSSSDGTYMPIIMPVSITLREVHTIDDIKAFDYNSYKQGLLPSWT